MLKVACSGPDVSRTHNLLVTSPIVYQLDHCTHLSGVAEWNFNKLEVKVVKLSLQNKFV